MPIPQDLDFVLYFNIAFFSVIGLAMFFGFLKGLKKSLYSFITTLIFYVAFFLTIDLVVNQLWVLNTPYIGQALQGIIPTMAGVTSLSQALPIALEYFLPDTFTQVLTNEQFLLFASGLGLFVVKLVYTLLYFTVIQLIYRFIMFLIRLILFGSKKKEDKYKSKNRGFGAIFGLLNGAMSVYVMLIILGGIISIGESLVEIAPPSDDTETLNLAFPREEIYQANYSLIPLAETDPQAQLDEAITMLSEMISAYNTNMIVTFSSQITMGDGVEEPVIPLNLYLFDSVLSFVYDENQISIRHELSVVADMVSVVLNNDYITSGNISDITGDDIREVFQILPQSHLITSIMPLAIEIAADYFDTDVTIPTEDLYAIDWEVELNQLGGIAATVFDIVSTAGLFNGEVSLDTVDIDGDTIRDLFDSLGESDLITLAAYVAIEPILQAAGAQVQAIITVPEDLLWEEEFVAIGEVIGAVLDTDISLQQLEQADPLQLISALAQLDFTVLLDSQIITNALINVLSGDAGIAGLEIITIPSDIVWLDEVDELGNVLVNGELRNILLAVNAVASVAGDLDLANLDFQIIGDLDESAINALFESRVLVATLSTILLEQDLGSLPLVIPDSVFDEDGYLLKTELQSLARSVKLVFSELACDVDDTQCQETGFDLGKAFSLEETTIDTLLSSDIIAATVGSLVIEFGADILVIPSASLTEIFVSDVAKDVISKAEIKKVFQAISVLGITDIENMTFDATILNNLGLESDPATLDTTKFNTLFASDVLHATLSDILLDLTVGLESVLVIPYYAEDLSEIRYVDVVDSLEYISKTELQAILQGILVLELSDFNDFSSLDLSVVFANVDTLLDSSILHATVSKQLFDLGGSIVTIPYVDEAEEPIRILVGENETQTEYIAKAELSAVFDALDVLGINDISTFSGDIDLSVLSVEGNVERLLSSAIIHATVSTQVLDLVTSGILTVPYVAEDNVTEIRVQVGEVGKETEYIAKTEIEAVFDALDVLGITDVTTFSGDIDLSVLSVEGNLTILLSSSIIHATVSTQVLDLVTSGFLTVPYVAEDNVTEIRVLAGEVGEETEYIAKTEIEAVFDALDVLGITDVTTFTGDIDLSLLSVEGNLAILLSSSIIHATVSTQVLDLVTSGILTVPYVAEDNVTEIRVLAGEVGKETEYIAKTEIEAVFDALDVLGITDVTTFTGDIDLSLIAEGNNTQILLTSSIIQATISQTLLDLNTSGILEIPYVAEDDLTLIQVEVGPLGDETTYISKAELTAMIQSLDLLGITDMDTFGGSVDLSLLSTEENQQIILGSSVIQATISKQLLDLDASNTLQVPYVAEDNTTLVRFVVGPIGNQTEYISKAELNAIFDALNILGITDVETFTGSVDLSVLAVGNNASTVVLSSVIQATISQTMIDLDQAGTIDIPYLEEDNTTFVRLSVGNVGFETEYISKTEIIAIIQALDVLGVTNMDTFGGSVDLGLLSTEENQQIVLSSSVIQATISKQLLDLDASDTLLVPYLAEDNLTNIRINVGGVGFETEYIAKTELGNLFDALDVIGIGDVESFTGSVDLSVLALPGNAAIVLSSSIIQATVSEQVLNLDTTNLITVPYEADDDLIQIRLTVGSGLTETNYVLKTELEALITSLDILGVTDVETFTGAIDISNFYDQASRTTLLTSSIMQATISDQILSLGDAVLRVPNYDFTETQIRLTVGEIGKTNEYVSKTEIHAMFEALELLGITDITSFTGSVSLTSLYGNDANQTILLSSASIHATITKQIDDLGSLVLTVPDTDVSSNPVQDTILGTHYIYKSEIKALINALEILGINDITSFTGAVSLTNLFGNDASQTTLLASASIHATITKQIDDLGSLVLLVPATDVLGVSIQETVSGTHYIYKSEIKALINALEILGINDITAFDGSLGLSNLFSSLTFDYDTNQNTLLLSASMHATISKQLYDLGSGVLLIPSTDITDTPITTTVSLVDFIYKSEIKAIINSLDVLGINDIQSFSGSFDLSKVSTEQSQNTLLLSASMHATITKILLDLGDTVLIVPTYSQLGEVEANLIQKTVSSNDFIIQNEIKALINAFTTMGYTNLDGFGTGIDSSKFFDDPDTLLLSSSIQATLSDKLLNGTGGAMIIPDEAFDTSSLIRIIQSDVTYVELVELKAIMASLEELGLTDFTSLSFTPATIFGKDYNLILTSYSMQATISDTILSGALDDGAAPGAGALIVPNFFRETILVATITEKQIEKQELIDLLNALNTIGVSDFSGVINASVITELSDAELQIVLTSGSMHVSIDNILKGNSNINTMIPDLAKEDSYNMTGITTKVEIINFIKATNILTTGSISDVSISVASIASLTPAERDIVLDSMIVRNITTGELETMMLADDPFDTYWPANSDYENSDPLTFLTEAGINNVLNHYGLI